MKIDKNLIAAADRVIKVSSPDQIDIIFSDKLPLAGSVKAHLKVNGFYSFKLRLSETESMKILVMLEDPAANKKEIDEKLKEAKFNKLKTDLQQMNKLKAWELIYGIKDL